MKTKRVGVPLSRIFLFGTERMKRDVPRDEAIEECQHTLPDGRRSEDPVMSWEEAAWMLDNGTYPPAVIRRLLDQQKEDSS